MRQALQWGVGCALGMVLVCSAVAADAARPALHLKRCGPAGARCGHLDRPLDSAGRVPGTIPVYFELYPATGPRPAQGTLVATEGGPGYAASASRAAYLALYAPLRVDHDVVLMDNRGSGHSAAIRCAAIDDATDLTSDSIARCGAELGERAALYGTADAADDLEAILAALGSGAVDLYGDSYGTFFAQVFARRHPARLRSLVLDGAYPLDGPDIAWLPDYAPAMRAKFDLACERDPRCAALPGRSSERLAAALPRLRTTSGGGLGAARYATMLFASAPSLTTLREADAAARAYLAGDEQPLQRLLAESAAATRPSPGDSSFSNALAAAVSCTDTPQLVDPALPPAARSAAFAALLADRERAHPDAFAPFTYAEYLGLPPDYRYLDQCLGWPAADAAHPPAYRTGMEPRATPIPVLVVSGDLDNITSAAEGAAAAAAWPNASHVVVQNGLHVNALPQGRAGCAADIVRRFIRTLTPPAESCAAPAVRLIPAFARRAAELAPVSTAPGDRSRADDRTLAAALVATVADALSRRDTPRALRGGRIEAVHEHGASALHLRAVRWCEDVAVSGTIIVDPRGSGGRAQLKLVAADGTTGRVSLYWPDGGPEATARLDGWIGGRRLRAHAPAP